MSETRSFRVTVMPADWRFEADSGLSLVLAARQAGIRLPSSCRNGTCRACLCRLQEGVVDYAGVRPGLSADERDEGWILPCVARARSDLVLLVPHARQLEPAALANTWLTGARR